MLFVARMNSLVFFRRIFYIFLLILPITITRPIRSRPQSTHLQIYSPITLSSSAKIRETRSVDPMEDEITVGNLTPQEILQLLIMRYNDKIHHEPRARKLLDEFTDKDISEICGTSASLNCGKDVLLAFEDDAGDVQDRCDYRRGFLLCIDEARKECKALAKTGIFPILPPKSEVSAYQGKIWRALWTSGGCLLAKD